MGFIAPIVAAVGGLFAAGAPAIGIGALTTGAFAAPTVAAVSAGALGSLAGVGTALSIGSGVIGAVGSIQSADAASDAAKYNAQVAANNAQQERNNAEMATEAGTNQAYQESLKSRAEVGEIKAQQAAAGLSVDSGSALDVRSSAQELGELNAINIRANAAKTAYGYETQSTNDTAQSTLDTNEANDATVSGYVNAGSTLLGTAGSAATNWQKWQLNSGSFAA